MSTPDLVSVLQRYVLAGFRLQLALRLVLAAFLGTLTPDWCCEHGVAARLRAVAVFAKDVVIGQYIEYYQAVAQ